MAVLSALETPAVAPVDRVDLASVRHLLGAMRGDPSAISQLDGLRALVTPEDQAVADLCLPTRGAWALLAWGRPAEALEAAEAAIAAGRPYGRRFALYTGTIPAAHAALWLGDVRRLAELLDELRAPQLDGAWFTGVLASLEAGLAARRGQIGEAASGYERAAVIWRGQSAPLAAGLAGLEAAALLPDGSDGAAVGAARAGQLFADLGAEALLARLRAGLAAS